MNKDLAFDDSLLADEFDQDPSPMKNTSNNNNQSPYPVSPNVEKSKINSSNNQSQSIQSYPHPSTHTRRPAPSPPSQSNSSATSSNDSKQSINNNNINNPIRPYPGLSQMKQSTTAPSNASSSASTIKSNSQLPGNSTEIKLNEIKMDISIWIKLFKKWGFTQERSSSYSLALNKMGIDSLAKADALSFEDLNPMVQNEAHSEAILYVIERTCDQMLDGKFPFPDIFLNTSNQKENEDNFILSSGKDLSGFGEKSDDKKQKSNKNEIINANDKNKTSAATSANNLISSNVSDKTYTIIPEAKENQLDSLPIETTAKSMTGISLADSNKSSISYFTVIYIYISFHENLLFIRGSDTKYSLSATVIIILNELKERNLIELMFSISMANHSPSCIAK